MSDERRRILLGYSIGDLTMENNTLDGKFTTSDENEPEALFLFDGRGEETTARDFGQKLWCCWVSLLLVYYQVTKVKLQTFSNLSTMFARCDLVWGGAYR